MKATTFLKAIITIYLIIIFTACGGGGGPGPEPIPRPVVTDEDGLTNEEETDGWDINLDRSGDGIFETVHVTSDPALDDSDGDGLTDDLEKYDSFTDPMSADSDGDGLNDYDEIYLHASSPISVDSDGDSVGDDPDNPLPSNALLHDGSEVHTFHSSPTMSDTDGDGLSDYFEIVESGIFNPAVANLPEVAIEIDPNSLPKVALEGSHTSIQNWGKEFSVTDSLQRSVNYSKVATSSTEITHNAHIKVGGELGGKFGVKDAGVSWKITGEVGYAFTHAHTNEVSWGTDHSTTAQQEYQDIRSQSESEELTVTGGTITTGLTVKNTGSITFDLTDLNLSVRVREPYGPGRFTEVMPLEQPGGFNSVTLSPLDPETGALFFEGSSTDVNMMTALIRDPSALKFEVGSFNLVDEYGRDFAYMEQNVAAKTAAVFIDYGGTLDPERYFVATNFTRDATGDFSGVTLGEVLRDILKIEFATAKIPDGNGGFYQGLTRVKTVERDQPNRYVWLVATTSESIDEDYVPDFEEIVLKAGDRVHLIFVRDKDDDGLSAREEFLFGTSDEMADSDGDGLSDFEEVVTGWRVPYAAMDIYPDPTRADDYDGDGLTDLEERDNQSDPFTPDTDEDGIYDADDPHPNDPDGSVEGFEAYVVSNTEIRLDWTPPATSDSFGGVVIVRRTDGLITDQPVDGLIYEIGDSIGAAQVIYAGDASTFTDSGLAQDTKYFYRLFMWHDFAETGQNNIYTPGISRSASTLYQIENVHNLNLDEITDSSIKLAWAVPARAEYRGVIIGRMHRGTVADMEGIGLTDGQPVYIGDTIENDQGDELEILAIFNDTQTEEYTDQGLSFFGRYGYKLFSFDGAGNYSSGAMVAARTKWGKINIELQVLDLVITDVNEGWDGNPFCAWCKDRRAELDHSFTFTLFRGKDTFHEDLIYEMSGDVRPGDVIAINEKKRYENVSRDWVPKYAFYVKNRSDLAPLWEPHRWITKSCYSTVVAFSTKEKIVEYQLNEVGVTGYLRFKLIEVP